MNSIKSLVLAIIVIIATSNIAFSQSINTDHHTDSLTTVTIKVKGITCSVDLKTIADNVAQLTGVNNCKPIKKGSTSTFEVKFDSSQITQKQIYAAIEGTGGCQDPNDRPYKVKAKR